MKTNKYLFALFVVSSFVSSCGKMSVEKSENFPEMILSATVNTPYSLTKAAFPDLTASTWEFQFQTLDNIKVTNDEVVETDEYYTFTKPSEGNFVSSDAETTSGNASWYAYFPSQTINLSNQSGLSSNVANTYALFGVQSNVQAGTTTLSIEMNPGAAILRILNSKGSIDINVKDASDKYISGLNANPAGFTTVTSASAVSLLTTDLPGVYYVVVPANQQIAIYDGTTKLKETKPGIGLSAGKYYTLSVGDPNLLAGVFSVSETKQVMFTKGNLWCNTTISPVEYHLESNQIAHTTTFSSAHRWEFYWTKTSDAACASTYDDGVCTASDKIFCDETKKITVDGTSGLYILSNSEFSYLVSKTKRPGKVVTGVTVDGLTNCVIIAPEGTTINESKLTYTLTELDNNGILCLPACGFFNGSTHYLEGTSAYYRTSSLVKGYETTHTYVYNLSANSTYGTQRSGRVSIRLCKSVGE